ncbi:hypothetical protein L596_002807 [Steinernema carpocapsae]|uniref:Uncharacterized protein n=1 Tax=Steinernema carpocapsae TaxID=34508 RepID=A0A4U8UR75_STECR|nr:hypothetical protein L596_002807 [Steinernema carpocapsae]
MDYNNLIVNVVKVKGLQLKTNKQLDVFVNASVTGKGSWKGKVCTDAVRTTTGDCEWNQLLEFALLGMDSQLQIQVQYKTVFGTTETLGQLQLVLSELLRYNMLTWFDLKKRTNDEKDRGQLLVAFNFSNKINSSISQFSLNKIDKEKKLDKLKRKMHLVRRKDKFGDSKSLASVSISRRSSMSSTASALAFPSPTPPDDEHMHNSSLNVSDSHGDVMNASSDQLAPSPQFLTPPTNHITMRPSPTSFGERVKVRAEQIVQPLMSAARHRKSDSLDKHGHKHGENELSAHDSNDSGKISRPSSSGFGSLASANVQNNEPQNPEYLLTIIAHQRREMAAKDNRIRDLEKYVDSLLLRVMEKNPELLQAPTPLGFY